MTTFTHSATFDTVMGDIKLGKDGEWAHPGVLQVQFQGIVGQEGQAVQGRIKTGRRLTSVVGLGGELYPLCREQPGPVARGVIELARQIPAPRLAPVGQDADEMLASRERSEEQSCMHSVSSHRADLTFSYPNEGCR